MAKTKIEPNTIDVTQLIRIATAAKKLKISRYNCYYRVKKAGIKVVDIDTVQFIDKIYLVDLKKVELHKRK